MASSTLTSKSFLGSSRIDGASVSSDLRKLSISSVQISFCSRIPKKLQINAAGSTFGTNFRVTTFGESHGGGVGCIIDGCPPRIPLSEADMQFDLDRRRPGQSRITTPRKETDTCKISSGVSEGLTTGTPIHVFVPNTDQRGFDYSEMSVAYRPSHADATYDMKYGVRSVQGGGRSSARETIGRVAAGGVAKKILKLYAGTEILAYVSQVHKVVLPEGVVDHDTLTLDQMESNIVRCPDPEYAEKMIAAIDAVRVKGDSVGGVVTCIVRNAPRGLGSPVFDKLEAELAKAAMSLPATKGFEFGSGFPGTLLTGSEHNDEFYTDKHGRIRTRTNRSGGIQGGISNGEIINMRIAFKPTSTIGKKQHTVTRDKKETDLIARGRHDPCVVPRAVPMVEAMVALVLMDQLMAQYSQCYLFPINSELQEPLIMPRLEAANASV
ncbi:PREDICTED: chorismate synthase, chloroplastic-like [Populus euphratica]|uniref:Chorismate synthase n=1 Tax=Populus euphratica TaxID=75702 RepID=A0AAJ6Y3Q5_POPEU|nr:PREDICTED: chorismate synthase, chloroplastic-like [Populus euphratica]XP_011040988.1 PREDICTED: chorismate synthase, chloroplastic-like [Populus euphratica]XP_011040989.1 PREDICTED: chorismate synthase, chloroplastic-like [Populus euphratica]